MVIIFKKAHCQESNCPIHIICYETLGVLRGYFFYKMFEIMVKIIEQGLMMMNFFQLELPLFFLYAVTNLIKSSGMNQGITSESSVQ